MQFPYLRTYLRGLATQHFVFRCPHWVSSAFIGGAYMLRRGRYKYICYAGYTPEFYDLGADPEELDNLAGLPAHAQAMKEFEQLLRATLDPEAVDRMAKEDQGRMIERYGGRDAVLERGGIHGTPAPANDKRQG